MTDELDLDGLEYASRAARNAVRERIAEVRESIFATPEGFRTPTETRMASMLEILSSLLTHQDFAKAEVEWWLTTLRSYANAKRGVDRETIARQVNAEVALRFNASLESMPVTDQEKAVMAAEVERVALLDRTDLAAARAEETANRIEQVEEHVRDLAGTSSTTTLSEFYASQALVEESSANWFRRAAIGLIVVAAVVVIFTPVGDNTNIKDFIRHLAFSVPALLLSGYLAREAGQHRAVARELRAYEVRLKTLKGYADGITDEETRRGFLDRVGTVLFTAPTWQAGRSDKQEGAQTNELDALLGRVVELVRAAGTGRGA